MYQHYAKKQVPSVMLLVDLENTLVFLGKKGFDRSLCIFNFNYCPLVWHFTSMTSTNKIESIQKRALRLLYNDYTSTYDDLLAKANKPSMELTLSKKWR